MDELSQKIKGLIVKVVILIILMLELGRYIAYDKLVIQKDNEEELVKLNNDLKDYKVKCGKTDEESCEILTYDLTLQDGSTKTVTEK